MSKIIECIPNFSEGQNNATIQAIADAIRYNSSVKLKSIDSGYYANRTVMTFLGEVDAVLEAAYQSISIASKRIDMSLHHGTHPRFGAVDVMPFVVVENVSEAVLQQKIEKLARRIAFDFEIPIYLYEKSATINTRKNLATIRKGEYENWFDKINHSDWKPDFGACTFNKKLGGMAMGIRNLLVAYNINLTTKDVTIAKKIAAEIRESGKKVTNNQGEIIQTKGLLKGVKALGWYIRDFDKVQVSINIVNVNLAPIHIVYETCKVLAQKFNVEVSGSELIGCIPKQCLIDAGRFYAQNKMIKNELTSEDLIALAIKSLNLTDVKPFDVENNIIDFDLKNIV